MTVLNIDDCINETCPWSGKPVQADSLTVYGDDVVGFCNPDSRDKFDNAVRHFEKARASSGGRIRQAMSEQGRPLEEFTAEFETRNGISSVK